MQIELAFIRKVVHRPRFGVANSDVAYSWPVGILINGVPLCSAIKRLAVVHCRLSWLPSLFKRTRTAWIMWRGSRTWLLNRLELRGKQCFFKQSQDFICFSVHLQFRSDRLFNIVLISTTKTHWQEKREKEKKRTCEKKEQEKEISRVQNH